MTSLIAEAPLRSVGSRKRRVRVEYSKGSGYVLDVLTKYNDSNVWDTEFSKDGLTLESALRRFSKEIINDQY